MNTTYLVTITLIFGLFVSSCSTKISHDSHTKPHADNKTPTLALSAESKSKVVKQGDYSYEKPTIVMSDDNKYQLSLYSTKYPIPLQKIHSWTVHIEYSNGKPVENVKIYIHGGMPAHRHGFPTRPRVNKYLGNGDYLIEGVKFSMIGDWEMRINIKEPDRRDRAVFKIPVTR